MPDLLVVFAFVIRYRVVAREERYLERKFGVDHPRYNTGAPRRI